MVDFSTACVIALKTSLLLVVLGGASMTLTRHAAAFRHALLAGTLLLSLCMPIVVLCIPPIAVIPAGWLHAGSVAANRTLPAGPISLVSAYWSIGWAIWLTGAGVVVLYGFAGHWGLSRWRRGARPLQSERWTQTLERVTSEWRFDRPLRVVESADAVNPCTWGFVRPTLLLPAAGDAWSEAERRHALMHELAHIRRHDYLSAALVRLACAMHWYNPLVWLATLQARRLQEQACDDLVLRSGATPSDYAQFLANAAAHVPTKPRLPVAALRVVRRSELRERIVAILDPARARRPPSRAAGIGTAVSAACLTLVFAAAVAAVPQDERTRPSSPVQPALHEPALHESPDAPRAAVMPVPAAIPVPVVPPAPAVAPAPAVTPAPPVEAVPSTPPDLLESLDHSSRRRGRLRLSTSGFRA